MIDVAKLSYAYSGKQGEDVLKEIRFSANAGECIGILGNNGAGKSTLLTCISQIRRPSAGTFFLDGQDIGKMSRRDIAQRVSYVAQQNELQHMTVFDLVLLGRKPHIKFSMTKADIACAQRVMEQLGLSDFTLRYVNELSGGERQKVFLARALVQEPKLLLLDEPTSDLDPKNQHEILALVQKLAAESKICVLMVLHDINLALRYCDRFLFLKEGRVHAYGDASCVTRQTMREVYDIHAQVEEVHGQKILIVDEIEREEGCV